jgi:hypothetical protein
MKTNVGSYDAGIRFVLGCVVLFLTVHGLGWWGLLGLIPIMSAACAFCPFYWVARIDTATWEEAREERHHHNTHLNPH